MPADPGIYLQDILDSIAGVRMAIGEADFDSYGENRPMRRAVEREIEIISEAARRIPHELREMEPDIPWGEIAGISNVLRHDYQIVSDTIMWNVVKTHIPALEAAVNRIINRVGGYGDSNINQQQKLY
jgi:uncharacterized protein with HEPN domain